MQFGVLVQVLFCFARLLSGASRKGPTMVQTAALEIDLLYGFYLAQSFFRTNGKPNWQARTRRKSNALETSPVFEMGAFDVVKNGSKGGSCAGGVPSDFLQTNVRHVLKQWVVFLPFAACNTVPGYPRRDSHAFRVAFRARKFLEEVSAAPLTWKLKVQSQRLWGR